MKNQYIVFLFVFFFAFQEQFAQEHQFDISKDLIIAQFDCKTDVDDLHTVAALATILTHPKLEGMNYHAVAGSYGIQKGLYVPAEELFELAFSKNWSDAHNDFKGAQNQVLKKVRKTLNEGGDIWVADAGQSDFSAHWIKTLVKEQPSLDIKKRIHIVQHSDWNEKVTTPSLLAFVKETIVYHKIPDGNAIGNGSPGFRSEEKILWETILQYDKQLIQIWDLAISIGNTFNGKEGRYLNAAIAAGGLDFSDLSEVCYIIGWDKIKDGNEFFEMFEGS